MGQDNVTHAAFTGAIRDVRDAASRLRRDRDRIDDRVSGYSFVEAWADDG
ncbi:hypothetical protein Q9S36_31340 [Microbacterium sp. ARD31]|nr:hypothetical protein [Microbacterium sp. ARD31]MDT0184687.1 hypothetical protein [Microbacterium sp. ARD31]